MFARCSAVPLKAVVLLAVILTACSSPTPTTPTAPIPPLVTVTGLTIGGVPTAFSYGQSIQLTAMVALPGGTQKETQDAVWESSDKAVATVSSTGLLRVTGFGDADVTATFRSVQASAHVTLPKPPAPSIRLVVKIDGHGSEYAINGVTDVSFDLSGSTGYGIRYDLDFGDGSNAATPTTTHTTHVYASTSYYQKQTVRATVTDVLGRTDTATQTLEVLSIVTGGAFDYWSAERSRSQSRSFRILAQDGRNVAGEYWSIPEFTTTSFTGTLTAGNDIHLVLKGGTVTIDGSMSLIHFAVSKAYPHILSVVRGGPDDGLRLDFIVHSDY
jgi:hypothetical protein